MIINPKYLEYISKEFEVYPDTPKQIMEEIKEFNEEYKKEFGIDLVKFDIWEKLNKNN